MDTDVQEAIDALKKENAELRETITSKSDNVDKLLSRQGNDLGEIREGNKQVLAALNLAKETPPADTDEAAFDDKLKKYLDKHGIKVQDGRVTGTPGEGSQGAPPDDGSFDTKVSTLTPAQTDLARQAYDALTAEEQGKLLDSPQKTDDFLAVMREKAPSKRDNPFGKSQEEAVSDYKTQIRSLFQTEQSIANAMPAGSGTVTGSQGASAALHNPLGLQETPRPAGGGTGGIPRTAPQPTG